MSIQDRIYNVFPDISWITLHKSQYPRIRFYLDSLDTLKDINNMTIDITKYIFEQDDIYSCLMLFSDKKNLDKATLEALGKRKLDQAIETNETNIFMINETFCLQYFSKATIDNCRSINQAIVEEDFWIEPTLSLRCYYFNLKKKLCINLYDDRGMDIVWDENELKIIHDHFMDKLEIDSFC